MSARPVASIIIPTYQRAQFLQDAVTSFCAQDYDQEFEILVVDNAPSAVLHDYVASLAGRPGPLVRYVAESRTGLHNARHAGARAARAELLVYADDDVLAGPGWLAALLAPYCDPAVACTGGKSLPQWETPPPEWASVLYPGIFSLLDYGDTIRELRWPEDLYGCGFSIRRDILFQVGGFHPDGFGNRRLIWYRGDGETGLLRKVYAAGYKVIYVPSGLLVHRIPATRLTPAYVRQRGFDQGISDEYSRYREKRATVHGLLVAASRAVLSYCYHVVRAATALCRRDRVAWIKETYWVSNCRARTEYRLRLMLDPMLREHVLREDYLEIKGVPDATNRE